MPREDNKIIKYNHREKYMKIPFIVFADLKSFLKKIDTCHNNPIKSSTTTINKHVPSGYSSFTHCSVNTTKNKHDYYRGKGCMKNFCKDLKEHATKIINYEKKEMIPLTYKENEFHEKQKVCYVYKK